MQHIVCPCPVEKCETPHCRNINEILIIITNVKLNYKVYKYFFIIIIINGSQQTPNTAEMSGSISFLKNWIN